MVMPLLGIFTGQYVSIVLGNVAEIIAGVLLVFLGGHMIANSMKPHDAQVALFNPQSLTGVLLFSLSVSVDSFSVGISLGTFTTNVVLAVLLFGFFGSIMSMSGLIIGRQVRTGIGEYGEALGGVILFVFGILFIMRELNA
jgi:putative Mn2+ efflux pump MntP